MADHCPTCGHPVKVVSSDEGTSHYEPVDHPHSKPQGEGEDKGIYDFSHQDALQAAAEDVDHLEDAGVREWSELLLHLEAEGWSLSRQPRDQEGRR